MSVNFKNFQRAFNTAVNSEGNITEEGNVNWNFDDADLHLDGWGKALGDEFNDVFNYLADTFMLNQASERLDVLKRDYLGQ
jgi:hypothetical protein